MATCVFLGIQAELSMIALDLSMVAFLLNYLGQFIEKRIYFRKSCSLTIKTFIFFQSNRESFRLFSKLTVLTCYIMSK